MGRFILYLLTVMGGDVEGFCSLRKLTLDGELGSPGGSNVDEALRKLIG